MTGEGHNYEKTEQIETSSKAEFGKLQIKQVSVWQQFTLTEEEVQAMVEAIGYFEYGVLNDSIIE